MNDNDFRRNAGRARFASIRGVRVLGATWSTSFWCTGPGAAAGNGDALRMLFGCEVTRSTRRHWPAWGIAPTCWVADRERPQPLATDTEPYPDTGGLRHTVPHVFIRCTDDDQPEEGTVTKLRSDERWQFQELALNHLCILYAPDECRCRRVAR